MRAIITIIAATTFSLTASTGFAAQKKAQCKFVVERKTVINGRCNFESDPDGSFRMWDGRHTVYLNVDGNTAEASWNKIPGSFHADSPLGTLKRNGACWVNATTKICARK